FAQDSAGNIQGLVGPTGTIPLSTQTSIASLGLMPLPSNSTVTGDATNGILINVQLPALAPFYAVKLVYLNYDTTATQNYDGAYVTAAPKSLQSGNNSVLFTWVPVTVNGSASFSVPIATTGAGGQIIPGIMITDFVPVTWTPRIDTVGAPPLLRVASHIVPSASSTNHPNYNGTNYAAFNALSGNPGLVTGTFETNGVPLSGILTSGLTVANSGGTQNPLAAIFYYNNVHLDIWEFGDSIIQGQGTTTHIAGLSEYLAFNSYGNPTQFSGMNFATSGQKTVDTMARLKTTLAAGAANGQLPKYALFKSWSPNDTPINTQSTFDTVWAYVMEMVNFCIQKGVQPIVCTGPFCNGYTLSMIQTQNARVMALPATVRKVDLFNIWTPGGVWNPSYFVDGTHPNDLGESAAANQILASVTY